MNSTPCVAVVIPSYRVVRHILDVIASIGNEVSLIYVVDDCCPDHSADFVAANCADPRVRLVRLPVNQGVGGAVLAGYEAAIADGADIIVKVDGDGQMDPALVPYFVAPIANGQADYTKGNRFFDLEHIRSMPAKRLVGNAVLSFMAKLSTGYWDIFDPTNGYTAIHAQVARQLPVKRISRRYFFETDLLFRLNTLRAVVVDVPMHAKYGDEVSNLKITKVIGEFLFKHVRNTFKRLFYNYYLRDLSVASLELPLGIVLLTGGAIFGAKSWIEAASLGVPATAGAVMLAALPMFVGLQLLLAFLGFDMASVPRRPIQSHAFSRLALTRPESTHSSVRENG